MYAISRDMHDAALAFIERGVDVRHVTKEGKTALFLAIMKGEKWMDVVHKIVEANGTIDIKAEVPAMSAIHYACQSKNPELVLYLIEHEVDVNRVLRIKDKNPQNAANFLRDSGAADTVVVQILEMLFDHGFDPTFVPIIVADYCRGAKPVRAIQWLFEHFGHLLDPRQGPYVPNDYDHVTKKTLGEIFQQYGLQGAPAMKQLFEKYVKPRM
jgi:hypothetical protein